MAAILSRGDDLTSPNESRQMGVAAVADGAG